MDLRIEISGDQVRCKQDGKTVSSLSLAQLFARVLERVDYRPLGEPIPETVRFAWRRGDAALLVLEERPALRTVRWILDNSPAPFGEGARYRDARLAFPFVVLVVLFYQGNLTGMQQCFYRRAPLSGLDDELLLPNLLNCAQAYGQTSWLCLANLRKKLSGVSWGERVRTIWSHLFEAGFNNSSEFHEGMSYWQTMRAVDARVSSLARWEEESAKDPFFPLQVEWTRAGLKLGAAMEQMINRQCPASLPGTAEDLMGLLQPGPRAAARAWPLFLK